MCAWYLFVGIADGTKWVNEFRIVYPTHNNIAVWCSVAKCDRNVLRDQKDIIKAKCIQDMYTGSRVLA